MDTYKEFIAFKSIFYFCSLPLRLDSYKGCSYNCLYCFSQCLNNRKSAAFCKPLPADPQKLNDLFLSILKPSSSSGIIRSCLSQRVPIHFGNVSDPFQPIEKTEKVSLEFLRTLLKNNYPTVISTKSNLPASPNYISLLKELPSSVQMSFSTFNNKLASLLEPTAPSPLERIRTLECLSKAGIWTVVRLQPFLFPKEEISDIPFRLISDAGVKHIILEHLRVPTNSSKLSRIKLDECLELNVLNEFKRHGIHNSRVSYELSSEVKLTNILLAREETHNNGMTFGSADNEFHHISDSPCCCGLPSTNEFKNYYAGNIGYSMYQSIRNGNVKFDAILDNWQPSGSVREYLNSDCRLLSKVTPIDYIEMKIDNPGSSNSPSSYSGIDYDENSGYIINEEFRNLFFPN